MRSKKIKLLLLVCISVLVMSGCNDAKAVKEEKKDKLKIVTTLFPQYDFVRQIAKDKVDVTLLLPPGGEAHTYEPTPKDIMMIQESDMFIYTGEAMEPWVHKIMKNIKNESLEVVDISEGISLLEKNEEHGGEQHTKEHSHEGKDPHIWLDLGNVEKMVIHITDALTKLDVANKDFYEKNKEDYVKQIEALDKECEETFKHVKQRTIVYGGHFTFGYFCKRYGLEHTSPYSGFSPDAEPSAKNVAQLIDHINELGVKVIYYQELIDPKVARIIADQTGIEMMLLHGAHNVTKQELEEGVTYLSIMKENLEKLKYGLEYQE